jgi:hypothetical protein
MGQFHDFEVALGRFGGVMLAEGNQAQRGGQGGEEWQKLGLDLDRDGGRPGGEGRQEAGELQRVAEAVVAADQHMAAFSGPAVPHPAAVIGLSGIIALRRVPGGEDVIGNGPGGFVITAAHRRHPVCLGIAHAVRISRAACGGNARPISGFFGTATRPARGDQVR